MRIRDWKIPIWNKHPGSATLVKLPYRTVPYPFKLVWKNPRVKVKSCCCVAGRWWAALPPRPLWWPSPWRASPSRSSPVSCRRPIRILRRQEHIWNICSATKNFLHIFLRLQMRPRCESALGLHCYVEEFIPFFRISEVSPQGAALPRFEPGIYLMAGWCVNQLARLTPNFLASDPWFRDSRVLSHEIMGQDIC